ncbi:amidase [Rhizobium paknamense]|uniref:Aspartyl-tRNA(Asn)/glutamyl-tRNA(Gln) amidotransferase subunit A n=1 Tax=Rhizobium paknamense TaxID=1206817 RepID=A0ABU0IET4_9HYPH|nr:amidase [Rhizobium paknamense]MDQ0456754.1 aspartyl-tRNA(Asn)/glutamyl-tRNA(Gln) amidotransferase subunit A [Rhizobium paknamense]
MDGSSTTQAMALIDPLAMIDPGQSLDLLEAGLAAASLPQPSAPAASALAGSVGEAGATDLLAAYADGGLTPSAAFHALKTAIDGSRAGTEAVLRLTAGLEESLAESDRRWADGTARPLEGVFFGVKDIIDVADTPTTCGSLLTGNRIAPADAEVVARLRAAGAIPLAMLATTEFACGGPHNPRFGAVSNPWDDTRWTGGSSTGSGAALAARLLPLALGTDTGGSIRVPSCWCGTSGLKPTRDLVSRKGVAPLSWTLDHVGPMARSVGDLAHVLPFMTARGRPAPPEMPRRPLRLGIPSNWFIEKVDACVLENWQAALSLLEAEGCELIALPPLDIASMHSAGWTILLSELASLQARHVDQAEHFDAGLLIRLKQGMGLSAADYGTALQQRLAAQQQFLAVFETVDLIVTPGVGGEAGSLETLTVDVNGAALPFQEIISRNTMIFDYLGFPALMLPSGLGTQGLPTGLQIAGPPGADHLCLSLGMFYQSLTSHHRNRPTLSRR